MLLNRIIFILFMIASGIFASFYGGNVSYAFFYMSLFIPIISFLYTFYVYVRFRLYQDIGQRIVVKGDLTPYSFTLANEDFITFRSIKVNFLDDLSTITHAESIREYCLLPNASETMETKLRCNYRGEYYVGANTVDIMDFLYLFKITYPILSKLKITVLPRVVPLSQLGIALPQKDAKISTYLFNQNQMVMDVETRQYQSGDSRKQIHWKVSAKRNELFSRKYTVNPQSGISLIMDLNALKEDDLTNIILEDQILESTLSIANYCKENNTKIRIYYEQNGFNKIAINNKIDFDLFYQLCVGIHFHSEMAADALLEEAKKDGRDNHFYIIVTHRLTQELYRAVLNVSEEGNELAILLMKDIIGPEEEEILQHIKSAGISFKHITREDEIGEVLNS